MIVQLTIVQLLLGVFTVTLLLAFVQWLLSVWIKSRLEQSIQHEYNKKLEEYRWENKAREKAESVARYLSLARTLDEKLSEKKDFDEANKLSWELAMWLPEEIYREMVNAIANPTKQKNELTTVVSVRKLILKEKAGDLNADNIAHHAPGIGRV